MTNPTPHGQVPEALIDLIDAYAETRHRCGGIYNARTEAARKAVIEALSGMQALSAAPAVPAGWKAVPVNPTPEMWKAAKTVPDPNPPYPPHYGLVWDAMLAASPTPPAERQVIIDFAQVGTAGPFHVVNGRVKLPDATMQDLARMLRPTYEAEQAVHASVKGAMWFTKKPVTIQAIQWTGDNLREVIAFTDGPPGPPDTRTTHAGMAWEAYTDLVARDGLKIYTLEGKMLASPGDWIIRGVKGEYYPCKDEIFRLTYAAASPTPPAEQAAPKAAPGEQNTVPADWLEQAYREGWAACRDAETIGEEAEDWAFGNSTANSRMIDAQQAAPQQEAQEPALFVSAKQLASLADPSHATAGSYLPARKTRAGLFTMALYTAPQPAPAPLSEMPYEKRKAIQEGEQIGASDAWFHARHNMLDTLDRRNVFRAGFDRGWNAALAAQGGKDALLF